MSRSSMSRRQQRLLSLMYHVPGLRRAYWFSVSQLCHPCCPPAFA
jgi:hypothetical protein